METQEIARRLRHSIALSEVDEADLLRLAEHCRGWEVNADEVVVREGEKGTEMYLIVEGEFVAQVQEAGLDLAKELARLGPGEFFGEIALLTGRERSATVVARTAGRLLVLSRDEFLAVLAQSPSLASSFCLMLGRYLAAVHRATTSIPLKRLEEFPDAAKCRGMPPEKVSAFCKALAVQREGDLLTVAMVNPHDAAARQFLRQVAHPLRVEFVGITDTDLHRAMGSSGTVWLDPGAAAGAATLRYSGPSTQPTAFTQGANDLLLADILGAAIRTGATDVHFEPRRNNFQVRMRIDGNLAQAHEPIPREEATRIVSRLKIIAELDVTERRMPQDGSFVLYREEGGWIDVRMSCLPGSQGEKIALRLLPGEGGQQSSLASLAFHQPLAMLLHDLFVQPSGLLLVTGPTGSGKTTTMYAGLREIHAAASVRNIMTIEDPVDHYLDFANQTPVAENLGRTFPIILRSVLRQDPNVILVGEIRDQESARIAIEAATTGHMVVTSLHTHFALDAIARLRVLNVESYLIGSSLTGIISQRLVARTCPMCAQPIAKPHDDEHVRDLLRLQVLKAEDLAGNSLKSGTGCDMCHGAGVRGRVALFEVLTADQEVKRRIGESATRDSLSGALHSGNFVSMQAYARYLLLGGIITPASACGAFPTYPMMIGTPGT